MIRIWTKNLILTVKIVLGSNVNIDPKLYRLDTL